MTSSDDLFLLIRALSKQEKRYFRLFAKRHVKGGNQNQYVEIFDVISKQDHYDEEQVKKFLSSKIQVKFFAPKKKYLFDLLLSSLQMYYANDSVTNKVLRQIHSVEILYKKGLFKTSSKLLAGAKQTAYKNEIFGTLPQLLLWEWELSIVKDADIYGIYKENRSITEQFDNLLTYKYLFKKLLSAVRQDSFLRNKNTLEQLRKIMDHPLLRVESMALSGQARYHYFNIHAYYYTVTGNKENGYIYCKKLLSHEAPDGSRDLTAYVGRVSNFLSSCLTTNRIEEHDSNLNKLNLLNKTLDKKKSTRAVSRLFEVYHIHLLSSSILKGEFQKILSQVPTIESGIFKYKNSITPYTLLVLHCQIAYAYFGAGDYRKSLEWINKIFTMQEPPHDTLYHTIKLMSLIVHFELGNHELLEYAVRSTYRFFYNNNHLLKLESVVIRYLKNKMPVIKTQKEFIESLKSLKKEIETVLKDPLEAKTMEHFDFLSWIKSKIENRDFGEIIKEKYRARAKS